MRVWVSINIANKFFFTRQTFGTKTPKNCCHVDVLGALVRWPLTSIVKVEEINFRSPPIKLLESLVHLTDGHSVAPYMLESVYILVMISSQVRHSPPFV